jgi:glycosyltransferase involved in cell wall biosynthesis
VQGSRGEFSCAKPAYVRFETAWISDRSVCYLASGKPVVVEYTGPSDLLEHAAGAFRFRDLEEAASSLEWAAADYGRQSRLARALAEEHFDARKVAGRVLERTLA